MHAQRQRPRRIHRPGGRFQHPIDQQLRALAFDLDFDRWQFGGIRQPEPERGRRIHPMAPWKAVPAQSKRHGVELPVILVAEIPGDLPFRLEDERAVLVGRIGSGQRTGHEEDVLVLGLERVEQDVFPSGLARHARAVDGGGPCAVGGRLGERCRARRRQNQAQCQSASGWAASRAKMHPGKHTGRTGLVNRRYCGAIEYKRDRTLGHPLDVATQCMSQPPIASLSVAGQDGIVWCTLDHMEESPVRWELSPGTAILFGAQPTRR